MKYWAQNTDTIITIVFLCILCPLFLFSCSRKNHVIYSGQYNSKTPSLFELYKYRYQDYDGYIGGTDLYLASDSTFILKNCGFVLQGEWFQTKDSLFLETSSVNKRMDSLNIVPLPGDSIPQFYKRLAFKKKGNELISVSFNRISKLELVVE